LPIIGIKYLAQLFNAVLLKGYFPGKWKVTQMILILKPGKPNELTSCWPISFLLTVSRAFKKLVKMFFLMTESNRLIPSLQGEAFHIGHTESHER
jgi:hypothetical protein